MKKLNNFETKQEVLSYLESLSAEKKLQWFQENLSPRDCSMTGDFKSKDEARETLSELLKDLFDASHDENLKPITDPKLLLESFKKTYKHAEMV